MVKNAKVVDEAKLEDALSNLWAEDPWSTNIDHQRTKEYRDIIIEAFKAEHSAAFEAGWWACWINLRDRLPDVNDFNNELLTWLEHAKARKKYGDE